MQAIDELAEADAQNVFQIGSTSNDTKDLPPQAADIWSWEVRRYFHQEYRGEALTKVRPSLSRLFEIPDGRGFFLGGEELRQMIVWSNQNSIAGLAEIPIQSRPLDEHVGVRVSGLTPKI